MQRTLRNLTVGQRIGMSKPVFYCRMGSITRPFSRGRIHQGPWGADAPTKSLVLPTLAYMKYCCTFYMLYFAKAACCDLVPFLCDSVALLVHPFPMSLCL